MKTTADEKVIYSTRFSKKIFVKAGIVSGVLFLLACGNP